MLDDDGIFVLQVAGIRPSWQYEDLVWQVLPLFLAQHVFDGYTRGLFMNKYVFPGADASCSLGWVINKVRHFDKFGVIIILTGIARECWFRNQEY
jgi:hypothetical protein